MRAMLRLMLVLMLAVLAGCGSRDSSDATEEPRDILDPSEVTRPTLRATQVVQVAPHVRQPEATVQPPRKVAVAFEDDGRQSD